MVVRACFRHPLFLSGCFPALPYASNIANRINISKSQKGNTGRCPETPGFYPGKVSKSSLINTSLVDVPETDSIISTELTRNGFLKRKKSVAVLRWLFWCTITLIEVLPRTLVDFIYGCGEVNDCTFKRNMIATPVEA